MHLLHQLAARSGWQLVIGHCNHRWRADADANARHVRNLAEKLGLPYLQVGRLALSSTSVALTSG